MMDNESSTPDQLGQNTAKARLNRLIKPAWVKLIAGAFVLGFAVWFNPLILEFESGAKDIPMYGIIAFLAGIIGTWGLMTIFPAWGVMLLVLGIQQLITEHDKRSRRKRPHRLRKSRKIP